RAAGRSGAGGRRGAGGWSGAVGRRTPIPGFSSTQNSGPSVGRLSSSSMTATALVANSGSRSFIQVSKTVQANLVPLEDDADGALAGAAQAELGIAGHVLRQVVDTPVGLPGSRRINLGRFLARQHQESSLDVGVVLAWRWALWSVFEAVQALLGEAMAPDKDRAYGQTHVVRDRGVGLTGGDTQDDLGTIRVLLGRCAGGHATLQFDAFDGQHTNTSTTGLERGTCEGAFGGIQSAQLVGRGFHQGDVPPPGAGPTAGDDVRRATVLRLGSGTLRVGRRGIRIHEHHED